jgi:nucleoid-associated protein EbfC
MGGFNLQDMLSQARQQAEKLQEKMQQITIEASSGGGSVTVRMSGQKQLLSIAIEPEVVKSGDIEMLQDLVVAAVNEASRKVDEALKSSLGGMLGGMGCRECEGAPGLQNPASEQSQSHPMNLAPLAYNQGSRTSS